MYPDDRRVDAWEASPGPLTLAVMAALAVVALPAALAIILIDLARSSLMRTVSPAEPPARRRG